MKVFPGSDQSPVFAASTEELSTWKRVAYRNGEAPASPFTCW
jgi:hypothetical protein